jgi:hypothetical protein
MPKLRTWRDFSEGNTGEVVLAIDFDATGRPEARFADLAERLGAGFTIWETLPAAVAASDGEGYVKQWADEVQATGRPVRAVLGFCAGAAFAPFLADRIAEGQHRPPLLLFDPEIVTPLSLYWQYAKVIEIAATTLTPAEVAQAQDAGRAAQQRTPDLNELAALLLGHFETYAKVAFDRMGLSSEHAGELMVTFAAFVNYLTAAGGLDPVPEWRTATVLSSTSPTSGLNGLRAIDPSTGDVAAEEIRFDLAHADLLRDDDVVRTVRNLLS